MPSEEAAATAEAVDLVVAVVAVDFAAVVAEAVDSVEVVRFAEGEGEAASVAVVGVVRFAEATAAFAAAAHFVEVEAASEEDTAVAMVAGTATGAVTGAATDSSLGSATPPGIGPVMPTILIFMDTPLTTLIRITTDTIRTLMADTARTDHMLLIRPHLLPMAA